MSTLQPRAFVDAGLGAEGERILAAMFGSGEAFARLEQARQPAIRRGAPAPPTLSSQDLWELVDARALDVADHEFRLVRASEAGLERIAPESYAAEAFTADGRKILAPDPDAVRRLHAQGATLVLQQLDRKLAPLARFCDALSARLGHPCQASAYLSPPESRGLDVHHDTHDVIVLQVEGDKEFLLFDPVVEEPVPRIDLPPGSVDTERPAARFVLRAGDLLYMRRGTPHCARAHQRRSLHLTIGVLAVSWAAAFERMAREMYFIEPLRRACPVGQVFDPEALSRSAGEMVACLQAWLQLFGAERLAALACETFVNSYGPRAASANEPGAPVAACSIEPAARGGSYLVTPRGRVAMTEAEVQAWLERREAHQPARELTIRELTHG